nr:translation initiation factor IF-2-like [Aegilops tauschii subsp. strangulata]
MLGRAWPPSHRARAVLASAPARRPLRTPASDRLLGTAPGPRRHVPRPAVACPAAAGSAPRPRAPRRPALPTSTNRSRLPPVAALTTGASRPAPPGRVALARPASPRRVLLALPPGRVAASRWPCLAPPVAASPNHAAASPAAPAAAPCRLLRPTSDRRAFPGPLSPLHQLRGPAPPPARRLGQLAVRRLRPRARPWRRLLCVPRRLWVAAPRAAASRLRAAPSGLAGFRSPSRCRASGRLRLAAAPGRLLQHPAAGSLAPPPPALSLSGLRRSLPAPPARPAPEHRHFRAGSAPAEMPRPPTGFRGPASPRLGRLPADPAPVPDCLLAAVPASSAPVHPARAGSPPLPHPTQASSSVPATPNLAPPPGLSAGRPRLVGSCPCRGRALALADPPLATPAAPATLPPSLPAATSASCGQLLLNKKKERSQGPAAQAG